MRHRPPTDQLRLDLHINARGPSFETLIMRCKMRCVEVGDYWDGAAKFLKDIQDTAPGDLTQKQKAWLHGLKQDLWTPGDT